MPRPVDADDAKAMSAEPLAQRPVEISEIARSAVNEHHNRPLVAARRTLDHMNCAAADVDFLPTGG